MNEISSKRGFRLSTTFKRIHNRLDASQSDSRSAELARPRSGNVLAVLGLVALTAVTSWVVARISIWLVPVYMSAMVLIFAAPRTSRPKAAAPVPEEPATEPGEGVEPTPDIDSQGASSVPVEPPATIDDAAAVSPKPRKRRGKGKRSTKAAAAAAAEADPTTAQVTWIRVGPGKFVRADVQDPEAEGSPSPVSISNDGIVADADADESGEGTHHDSLTMEDGTTRDEEAPEEPGSSELFEPSEVAEVVADEPSEGIHHDSLTMEVETTRDEEAPEEPGSFGLSEPPEVSEARAEEHGIAPSTLGEGPETTDLSDEADHEDFRPGLAASPAAELVDLSDEADHEDFRPGLVASLAAEPIADAEPVAAPAAPIASISIPSTTATRDPGPTRPAVLLDNPTAETHRRRTVGPVVRSSRFRNVRRGDAPRPSTLNGRTVDLRLRQRSSRIRSRLIHVERDFHPRSPPMRA